MPAGGSTGDRGPGRPSPARSRGIGCSARMTARAVTTGLLLDMGRPVTITSAQIMLGAITGAEFQLRVGGEPVLADLRPVVSATAVGGFVTLRPARPAKARYLLLWFTRLPPDSGTFQAILYNVRLHGIA